MEWLSVGKTIVAHGQGKSRYVLIHEADAGFPVSTKATLPELAAAVRNTRNSVHDQEVRFIKNDLPAIIWTPDDTVADRVLECERLDKSELRELAKLLLS